MNTNAVRQLSVVCLMLFGLTFSFTVSADSAGVDALLRAQQAADQQTSYRISTTSTDASGKTLVHTLEYVKPDRFHMQSSDSRGGGEFIVIGKDSYLRRGLGGAWQKSPMDLSRMIAAARGGGLSKEMLDSTTVTLVGPSSLSGVPMMVYAMTYAKDNLKSTGKLWIGTADKLPHQAQSDVEIPVTKVGGKSFGGKSHALTLWDYNLKLEIKAPI